MLDPYGTAGYWYDDPDENDPHACPDCGNYCHCDADYDREKDDGF